ncbi:B12-binding domain-containing radical SAM protein [Acidobacteria bacterium AH-259-D05]|nr:B12-binding domain-containing radical SAM protein [Acidobacteria bacterium AH-259-D05]
MSRILLINPSYMGSYAGNKMSVVSPILPVLSLATIAATAREGRHKVKILDLFSVFYDHDFVRQEVRRFRPAVVGITALTPCVNQLIDMSLLIKDISQNILVVGGGPHVSSLPVETLRQSCLDSVVVGEGDYTFKEICDGKDLASIDGLYYRKDGEIRFTGPRPPIGDLNELPFPAWDLYDPEIYKSMSRLLCRRPPVISVEFSRGCVFKCDYCASKMTMALGYRKKTPERCAEEVKYLFELGFREFMTADDIFTSDERWAAAVSEAIAQTGLDVPWTCTNGIRVESADPRLFKKMRQAGCYRVSFGFESGNDEVLKKFGKGGKASVTKGIEAVETARKAKIETNGFFMLGLSCDTEETMEETIEFARKLPVDLLKFSVTIPFPGTEMFNRYVQKNLIKSYNWDDYHIYSSANLFTHEYLKFETIQEYMKRAFRRAIIANPSFIIRRIVRGFRTGEFFWDLFYFFRFIFSPTTNQAEQKYYARAAWPKWDFEKNKPAPSFYQKVGSGKRHMVEVKNLEAVDSS